jgi:nucleotide-binding universal stress UspA family protein
MFEHVLVPLDGSRLAEAALPPATYLAQALGASVTLVHIIERDAPQTIHGERHLVDPEETYAYLDEVVHSAFPTELHVKEHVHTSQTADVAHAIVDHTEELSSDLIVMCTHGQGGLRDLLFGSIAQQVLALGTIPVLLIRPRGIGEQQPFNCRKLLVPLDSMPDHEQGLGMAIELAHACGAELHLLLVVPTLSTLSGSHAVAGRFLPGATTQVLELSQQEAEAYLHRNLSQLQAQGVSAKAEIGRGEPVANIFDEARKTDADLIVMGTHGKAGIDAFWSGSIAPKISSRSRLPLLLVPITKVELNQEGSDE